MRCLSLFVVLVNASLGLAQTVLIDSGKPQAILCTTERMMAPDRVMPSLTST